MKTCVLVVTMAVAMATSVAGQTPAAGGQAGAGNPLTAGAGRTYGIVKGYISKAAAKMPEDQYGFKPTPDVRSFGQLVAHIADANYGFCAAVTGQPPPAGGFDGAIEKAKTTKADLEKALADSFAYCDKAHAAMTDAAGAEKVKFFGNEMAKLSVLEFNTHHEFEHYGNIVTYLRLKNIVPPSSEPRKGND